MKKIPTHLEFSSLPKIIGEEGRVVISVAGYNQDEVNFAFKLFLDFCLENKKEYVLEHTANWEEQNRVAIDDYNKRVKKEALFSDNFRSF